MPGGHCTASSKGKNRGQDAFALYADANFLNGILAAADDSQALRYSSFRSIGEKLVCKKMFLARFQGREREKATIRALPTSSERKCTGHSSLYRFIPV